MLTPNRIGEVNLLVRMIMLVRSVMCIGGVWNLCWSHSPIRIPMMTKSQYVIAGILLILPTLLLTTSSTDYCPKGKYMLCCSKKDVLL